MAGDSHGRSAGRKRWYARLALLSGAAALVLLVVFAGLKSLVLLGVAAAGIGLAAAALWWFLTRRGVLRMLAGLLLAAVPAAVIAVLLSAGLLWVALTCVALWAVAGSAGKAALADDTGTTEPESVAAAPVRRPFFVMNPRSGGGKVGRFRLKEEAEALGAEVLLLDPDRPVDVTEVARQAVIGGADLLGVAGGDGTQALVAAVAAHHDVPFTVIPAGTRNHFALDLGLDRDNPAAGLGALTDGVELRVDLGFVGERVFVNNASFGTYATVVQSPAYRDDKIRTILSTLPDLLTRHTGPRLLAHAGDTTIDGPQALLVSNNPYRTDDLAGLGRRDRLDTGLLGVLGISVDNAAQAAALVGGSRAQGLTSLAARDVVIDADTPTVEVGIDGEALTVPVPVHCRVAPGALRVRVPRDRPGTAPAERPVDWRKVRQLALTMGRTAAGRPPTPASR